MPVPEHEGRGEGRAEGPGVADGGEERSEAPDPDPFSKDRRCPSPARGQLLRAPCWRVTSQGLEAGTGAPSAVPQHPAPQLPPLPPYNCRAAPRSTAP